MKHRKYIWIAIPLIVCIILSCKNITSGQNQEHVFIDEGTPKQVIQIGGEWITVNDALCGTGESNYLIAGKTIINGDFEIQLSMSLDSLNYSSASILLEQSHFYFDQESSRDNKKPMLAIDGPLFEGYKNIDEAEKYIQAGIPFDVTVKKRSEKLTLSINKKEIVSVECPPIIKGAIALCPSNNKMRVFKWMVFGNMSPVKPLNYIFESGKEGYHTFRVPAVVTTNNGTILAFAEGRKSSQWDTGNIDLVMKRSEDNGQTWSNLIVLRDDAENVCGNPAPVVDKITGTIYLLSSWHLSIDGETVITHQKSKDTRRVFIMQSGDDGKTWSEAKEITQSVKLNNWTWYATGPCHGIQMERGPNKGRLIIPCDHVEAESETYKYFSHIIFSDDHGKTWKLGGSTPQDQVNECTVAELSDGMLMLNMRTWDYTYTPTGKIPNPSVEKTRKIAISKDGGIHWDSIYADENLIEPICQGSLLMYSSIEKGKNKLLFLNPANKDSRKNITLRLSDDDGQTWPKSKVLYPGPSSYSDMTIIPNGNIGCFFEAGYIHRREGIVFREISLDEILK